MNTLLFSFLILGTVSLYAAGNPVRIYVSPDGDDNSDGSVEKPFASLYVAVEAVRMMRSSGNDVPANIFLRKGQHHLSETIVLGLEDEQLTIAAFPGEEAVVSSGIPVTGWKLLKKVPAELPAVARDNVWVADMPKGMNRFYTLYDRKGRLDRARGNGFVPTKNGDKRTVHFPDGALKDWANLKDVELNIRPGRAWVINMLGLESVDESNGIARTAVTATYDIAPLPGWVHLSDGNSAWIENVIDVLDEPGEWVVNTKTRKIYLWPSDPAPNGSPRGVLAPTLTELIRVEGEIDYDGPMDKPARGITISGLTFTHADRWAWIDDADRVGWGMQHDWDMFDRPTAMLRFRGAEECVVTNCRFVDSGGSGVRFDLHAQRNRVVDCEFANLGEAGILLSGYGPGTKDVNHHNEILNNHIHHFSEISWHSPGIWAWQSGHNRIANNNIHHSGYTAVMITNRVKPDRSLDGEGGRTIRRNEIPQEIVERTREDYTSWKEREPYIHARHNILEYNEISHTVQRLSDGNCIYVSGAGTGNIVRYNYLHDNLEHSFPAAIRCDDDQHEALMHGNVLYNNYGFSAGIASKGRNDITNNFIVAPRTKPTWGYISFEWVRVDGSKSYNNVIISHSDGGRAQSERPYPRTRDGDPSLLQTEMDNNLYYHPTDPNWIDTHLTRMRSVGMEEKSQFADPMFVDPVGGDFSFQQGSPAIAMGIEELDVSLMGLKKKPFKEEETLEISDGSELKVPEYFPEFSWEVIPQYFMFGDTERVLYPEEVTSIAARTGFICIEKSHGMRQLGDAELGAKHDVAAFKKEKPGIKVLFYFNSAWAWPFTSYNKGFAWDEIDKHPELKEFLVVNPETGKLNDRRKVFSFDVLNPEFREWWVDTVMKGVETSGADGVFIDQMHGFAWLRPDRTHEVERAMGELMATLKRRLGPNRILLGNNAHDDMARYVFPSIDANMFEHYSEKLLSKEALLRDWENMLKIAKAGKMSIFRIGVEHDPFDSEEEPKGNDRHERMAALAKERVEYWLACYLIGAQPYSYFQYGWGWTLASGSLYDYPELQRPLGPPNGPFKRLDPNGWEFTREFEHASVWVDTKKGQAKITWHYTD
ncbi:MAG: putative glycoside hydrolase [Puniceicoccaceae bacterium]